MTAIFIDTSYLLALINSRDRYHTLANQVSRTLTASFVTSEAVLLELGNGLAKPPFRRLAVQAIIHLQNDKNTTIIPTTHSVFSAGFDLFQTRPDKAWGLVDCTSFIIMRQLGLADVLTTDHHFTQAGFNRLIPIA